MALNDEKRCPLLCRLLQGQAELFQSVRIRHVAAAKAPPERTTRFLHPQIWPSLPKFRESGQNSGRFQSLDTVPRHSSCSFGFRQAADRRVADLYHDSSEFGPKA